MRDEHLCSFSGKFAFAREGNTIADDSSVMQLLLVLSYR